MCGSGVLGRRATSCLPPWVTRFLGPPRLDQTASARTQPSGAEHVPALGAGPAGSGGVSRCGLRVRIMRALLEEALENGFGRRGGLSRLAPRSPPMLERTAADVC